MKFFNFNSGVLREIFYDVCDIAFIIFIRNLLVNYVQRLFTFYIIVMPLGNV